jgi:hypothetical protein
MIKFRALKMRAESERVFNALTFSSIIVPDVSRLATFSWPLARLKVYSKHALVEYVTSLSATIRVRRNYLAEQVRLAVVALKARAEYHETEERFNL